MAKKFTKYPSNYVKASSALADAKEKSNKIAATIESMFLDNDIIAELLEVKTERFDNYKATQATISFEIEGDWRHAHEFADNLVREAYGVYSEVTEDDGAYEDDYYTAIHTYRIRTDGERDYL